MKIVKSNIFWRERNIVGFLEAFVKIRESKKVVSQ